MRTTLYAWHGGQTSPLYAAASSGFVANADALANELHRCAASMRDDQANIKGPKRQRTMRASAVHEWNYLRRLADSLPLILGPVGVHKHTGETFRCLPWARNDELAYAPKEA